MKLTRSQIRLILAEAYTELDPDHDGDIGSDELYRHFDADEDGQVTDKEYDDHIKIHMDHPEYKVSESERACLHVDEAVIMGMCTLREGIEIVSLLESSFVTSKEVIEAVVTEKKKCVGTKKAPVGSPRQRSFCKRMCGHKKKNTGAKTAEDPDSCIRQSLRRWRCRCS